MLTGRRTPVAAVVVFAAAAGGCSTLHAVMAPGPGPVVMLKLDRPRLPGDSAAPALAPDPALAPARRAARAARA